MAILISIIALSLIVFFHELGHFLFARISGFEVEEFGIGFPPKIFGKKIGKTTYSINAIFFGGFVKVAGEDDFSKNYSEKKFWQKFLFAVGGIVFNIFAAWIILSAGYFFGLPIISQSVSSDNLYIVGISEKSPAKSADLKIGDKILSASFESENLGYFSPDDFRNLIKKHDSEKLKLKIGRNGEILEKEISLSGIMPFGGVLGASVSNLDTVHYGLGKSLIEGFKETFGLAFSILRGIWDLILGIFGLGKPAGELVGPVGIAAMGAQAAGAGWGLFLRFCAGLSAALAVSNLIPFPALDGGRLLIIILEKIKRKTLSSKFQMIYNGIGFAILILLMIFITGRDILKFF